MQNVKNTMIDNLLAIVAPHLCCGCGQVGTLLCSDCKYNIIIEPYGGCLLCGKLASDGICTQHQPVVERAWCVGERSGPLQRLIGSYKFKNTKAAFGVLGDLLDTTLPVLPDSTIFVPIPTASNHIRERGYDHMGLLADYIASRRQLPVSRLLARRNNTTQRHATRQQRLNQARQLFSVNGTIDPQATYMLLDDVVTTGATVQQAAKLLRQAGAKQVWIATLARQPID